MKAATEITLETVLISVLNIGIVYLAAFTYKLNWEGVMTAMILGSLFTAGATHFILTKLMAARMRMGALISEGMGVMSVALLSSLAVLVILTNRFNFPQALGISLLSGLLSSLIRHMMA